MHLCSASSPFSPLPYLSFSHLEKECTSATHFDSWRSAPGQHTAPERGPERVEPPRPKAVLLSFIQWNTCDHVPHHPLSSLYPPVIFCLSIHPVISPSFSNLELAFRSHLSVVETILCRVLNKLYLFFITEIASFWLIGLTSRTSVKN